MPHVASVNQWQGRPLRRSNHLTRVSYPANLAPRTLSASQSAPVTKLASSDAERPLSLHLRQAGETPHRIDVQHLVARLGSVVQSTRRRGMSHRTERPGIDKDVDLSSLKPELARQIHEDHRRRAGTMLIELLERLGLTQI